MTDLVERPLNELDPRCQDFLDNFSSFNAEDVLLGYQKRWIADDAQIKVGEKSRRIGLTWAEAADNALDASTRKRDGGCDTFYIGSSKEMAREYIDAVAMWAQAYNYAASETQEYVIDNEDKDIQVFVIYFASGFKVKALSSSPKNLRGMQGNVVIDEAAHHEHFSEVLKAALALTMWGNKVRIISTHNGEDNDFNEYIKDCRAGKKRGKIHTTTIQDACDDGLYQRICQVLGYCQVTGEAWSIAGEKQWIQNLLNDTDSKEDALEEYFCVPKFGGGRWLTRALIEKNMTKDVPIIKLTKDDAFNLLDEPIRRAEIELWCEENLKPVLEVLNKDLKHYAGEDFARSGDLSVLAIAAELRNLDLSVQFILELGNIPYAQQEQIIEYVLSRLPKFSGGAFDARGNGGSLAEKMSDKFGRWNPDDGMGLIDCVMLSDKWYRENTPAFKTALEDGALVNIPRNDDVLKDLRAFERVRGIPKIPDKRTTSADGKTKRHGDSGIALLLLDYARRVIEGIKREYAYEAVTTDDWAERDIHINEGFRRGVL